MNEKKKINEVKELLNNYLATEDPFEQTELAIQIIQGHVGRLIKQAEGMLELKEELEAITGHYNNAAEGNNWRDDDRIKLREEKEYYKKAFEELKEDCSTKSKECHVLKMSDEVHKVNRVYNNGREQVYNEFEQAIDKVLEGAPKCK